MLKEEKTGGGNQWRGKGKGCRVEIKKEQGEEEDQENADWQEESEEVKREGREEWELKRFEMGGDVERS